MSASPDIRGRVVSNTAAQILGRNLIALGRLVIAGLIVRACGKVSFGEYSLLLGLLAIAEWVLDFGTTEMFVREISREPERRGQHLRTLLTAKIVQIPSAFVALTLILFLLGYPASVVKAGLIGGIGLIFFGGVLVYRTLFKAELRVEREATAELVSVIVMIPLVVLVCRAGGDLAALLACHLVSRAVFFGLCLAFGASRFRPSISGVTWADVRSGFRASAVMGVIGLMAGAYEALDLVMLSKLDDAAGLAYYSGAQRLVWPLLLALASVGGTLYPVASTHWPHARDKFERAAQQGLDAVVLLAGLGLCPLLADAEFFMGLLGPDLVPGAAALMVLATLVFLKTIPTTLAPLLYVVHAQGSALRFIGVALVAKLAVLWALIPRFGYMGAAGGAVAVELCCGVLPTLYLLRRFTGQRLRWAVPLKSAMVSVGLALGARLALPSGGGLRAVTAAALFVPLSFAFGMVDVSDIRMLLRRRSP